MKELSEEVCKFCQNVGFMYVFIHEVLTYGFIIEEYEGLRYCSLCFNGRANVEKASDF